MKSKITAYALAMVLLSSFACAQLSFVIDDKSPGSDTVLAMNIITALRTEGVISADYMAPALLNSEVNVNYLQGRTTVFVYHGKAAIIIGDAVLGNRISNSLKSSFNIDSVTKLSSDIKDDDLTLIFEKRDIIQPTKDKEDEKDDKKEPKKQEPGNEITIKPECEGCLVDTACREIGSRFSVNDVPKYCDKNREIVLQKPLGSECEFDYECEANQCIDDICTTIPREEPKEKGFFQKIWSWIKRIFR